MLSEFDFRTQATRMSESHSHLLGSKAEFAVPCMLRRVVNLYVQGPAARQMLGGMGLRGPRGAPLRLKAGRNAVRSAGWLGVKLFASEAPFRR